MGEPKVAYWSCRDGPVLVTNAGTLKKYMSHLPPGARRAAQQLDRGHIFVLS